MSFKTTLVCLNEIARAEVMLAVACAIAERQQAHLTAVYAIPAVHLHPSAGVETTAELLEGYREFFWARSERLRAQFETYVRRQGVTAEWQLVESTSPLVADPIVERARVADLVIVSQVDRDRTAGVELDFTQRVIMESGRPVLVVPAFGTFSDCGRRVLVGWNATREAARAAFDAVPILRLADSVHVTWVDPHKSEQTAGPLAGAEMAAALSRHGVKAVAEGLPSGGLSAGEALLSRIADLGADLLVMGAYGHSRMREFVFGGATRFILQSMTVPVLMSH